MHRLSLHRSLAPLVVAPLLAACDAAPAPAAPVIEPPPAAASAAPSASPSASTSASAGTPASEPLSVLCARVPTACAPFDQAATAAETCAKSKHCAVAKVGTCGPGHFIETVESFSSTVRHYDASGALVSSCGGNMEHGGLVCFGTRPACQGHIEKSFGAD